MRSHATRHLAHGVLLGALAVTAVDGLVILGSYLVMLTSVIGGPASLPELTPSVVAFGVLMITFWSSVAFGGLSALARQGTRTVRLARWVARAAVPASPKLAAAAGRAESPAPVLEIPDQTPYAFTYGIWRPRVVASAGLVNSATRDELAAVLRHESYHVRHRDPLKVLALRTWAAALFFVPLVSRFLARVLDHQELKADRAAMHDCGVPPVAGALLKSAGEPSTMPGTAVAAMGGPALLDTRVAQLETGHAPRLCRPVPPSVLFTSLPGIALIASYGVLLYHVCIASQMCCLV
ncbi:M56 family peptidase [Actinobacteria bacterium YIM 96077]|uniref:Peptidase M48 domain-containing protein n=1 Tax=Phytoactinopolyspora halophila TaxID=1981511 RepID=A0A329QZ40_9ACTN|nr:M56 family metallopeptidase [Phytoactinopolyspora halophila]AYY13220.1 M56 family peptidase [Actinobacteria bacterium YIM 96077]RAW17541.1 hypothetical protein DPM12_05990 [Phytoactinopolyspora halophila]